MSDFERSKFRIKSLPSKLGELLNALKSDSEYLKVCFGKDLIDAYVTLKEDEISQIGSILP